MEENNKGHHTIRIENIDIWNAMWITYFFYRLIDRKEIESVEIKKIKKAEGSIDLIIEMFIGYCATKTVDYLLRKIYRKLIAWKEKRNQTTLKIFMDDGLI